MRIGRVAAVLALGMLAPAMAMADTLATVGQSGVFTIGYRTDAAPFSFENGGQPTGYSVELCAEIGKAVGEHLGRGDLNVVYKPVSAETRFAALAEGEIDILCGATTVTLSRRKSMDFSLLTYVSGTAVMARNDSAINSLADMAGRRMGVLGGTTTEQALRRTLEVQKVSADIVPYGNRADGVRALLDGDVDAFFGDRELLLGTAIVLGRRDSVRVSNRPLTTESYALAMRRGDDDLRLVADSTLARLYRGDRISPYLRQWFTNLQPPELLLALIKLQAIPE